MSRGSDGRTKYTRSKNAFAVTSIAFILFSLVPNCWSFPQCLYPRLTLTKQISRVHFARWGRLWYHTHEQHLACSPPVSRLITFPPTSWLLLPWQPSPPGKVRSDAAHPVISTRHRLRTSEIPRPKSVSSAVTHRCHHRPALPFRDWHPFTNPVLILAKEISSTVVPRGFAILYPISRSGT